MKKVNLRVDEPILRAKFESITGVITVEDIMDDINTRLNGVDRNGNIMIRIKSIVLRAHSTVFAEHKVSLFGRPMYAIFKTNSLVASMSSEGTVYRTWVPAVLSSSKIFAPAAWASFEETVGADALSFTDLFKDISGQIEQAGVTAVVNYEVMY